jgi:hypothetical protein
MASTESTVPVNGTYAHQYEANNYAAANANSTNNYNATQPQQTSNSSSSEIPKEEVAWYFVEQYYTTLSKTPERLYVCSLLLHYNVWKRYADGS